jgi:hypothetical protein
MHADLPSPTVSEIRSLEVVPASRFPGYRPIAVVEIGRFQLGGKFSNPRISETVRRIGFKFRDFTTVADPFVWHRSDVDPTCGFSSWGRGPQIFDLP